MNSRTMRLAVGLGGLLATAGLGLGIVQGAFAQSDQPARQTGEQAAPAPAIPMEQVLAQLKAEGYGEVYEIEREHGKYEVKAKNRDGRTVELSSMRAPARRSRPRKRTTTEARRARSGPAGPIAPAPTLEGPDANGERRQHPDLDRSLCGRPRSTGG